ncbi:hypothetical protein Xclt_08675 [Xanthomonas axonopodis pv. clitoriae]|uniref:Uncharacterized protein n=1 Tax=Xanthomonas axonopodis pv. clitoriae TaxID=487828 RepID=A0AB73MRB3_9XANT|nr:hypothetical protein Xclt_08675 [Xanthomonas axonopodis pv. clitoriae]
MRKPIFRSNFLLRAGRFLRPTWARARTTNLRRKLGFLLGSEVLAKAAQQIGHLQECARRFFFEESRFLLFELFQLFRKLSFGRRNRIKGGFAH